MISESPVNCNDALGVLADETRSLRQSLLTMEAPCRGHNAYRRTVILDESGCAAPMCILVPREWNSADRKRHSHLPGGLIKDTPFSRQFIYSVLRRYQQRGQNGQTVQQLCDEADISVSTLYRWKSRYWQKFILWLCRLTHSAPVPPSGPAIASTCQNTEMYTPSGQRYDQSIRKAAAFPP